MIKLSFPKLSCFDRKAEVCTVATPHAQGVLKDAAAWTVFGANGAVPTQNKATAFWPDGSIKWLLSCFEADLPANRACGDYYLAPGAAAKPASPAAASVCGNGAHIENGVLDIRLGAPGQPIFASVKQANGAAFGEGEISGPTFREGGQEYTALVGEGGWKMTEEGPVRVRLETRGKHTGAGGARLDYHLAVIAFAGKPYIHIEYRFIHCEEDAELALSAMRIDLRPNTAGKHWLVATSNYATKVEESSTERVSHIIDAEYLRFVANEQIPEINFGTYFSDWSDGQRGVCATVYQAYQNFPKAFDADASGVTAWIIPDAWGDLRLFQGMAKTTRMMLHFHDGKAASGELDVRSQYYQMPDKPSIPASAYTDAGLYREFIGSKKQVNVEMYIRSMGEGTGSAYGMLAWGDCPDGGYTAQGRAQGDYVWTNNEYDYPHQCMIEYARTGNRMYLDRLLVAAEHWRDVDVCHFSHDHLLMGGQHIHSRHHVAEGCKPSHEWVEGLWDYYHLTGDEFARDTVMGIAENIRRVLVEEIFPMERYTAAREAGWALRSFCAMYTETGDEQWLEYGERIVDYFDRWKQDYGAWLSPYTSTTMIRVPFMIAVASISLMLYWRIRPSDRVKNLIVGAVDDILANCCIFEGGFMYYKELVSLQRTGGNTLVLQALTMAYELTGNKDYITCFVDFFRQSILSGTRGAAGGGAHKVPTRDALVIGGDSPKRFGQSYPPIASYYKVAMELGLLPEGYLSYAPWDK